MIIITMEETDSNVNKLTGRFKVEKNTNDISRLTIWIEIHASDPKSRVKRLKHKTTTDIALVQSLNCFSLLTNTFIWDEYEP